MLKWNKKTKKQNGLPKDDLLRLLCFSGRTSEAIDTLIDNLNGKPLDEEFIALLYKIFKYVFPCKLISIIDKILIFQARLR